MNKFPKLPFTLDDEADDKLVRYLRNKRNFGYLGRRSRAEIAKLSVKDLRGQHKILVGLWPSVLTDALLTLKKCDSREWPGAGGKSFFHEGSLGVSELREVFTGFMRFESMLYGAFPDRYREHVAHAFRVWIIGQVLLKEHLAWDLSADPAPQTKNGDESLTEKAFKKTEDREWAAMWAIAALCHDIGYPLAAIEKINEKARDTLRQLGLRPSGDITFAFSQQMLPFHDSMIKLMASKPVRAPDVPGRDGQGNTYLTHLQNKYYLKLLKSFDNLDHGIVSALLVSKALVYFLESDLSHDGRAPLEAEDVRQFLIRREILRAIASHTCEDLYHLKFNTLSFVLYIVDEIQRWGRPTLEELQGQTARLAGPKTQVEEFSPDRIRIQLSTEDEVWDNNQKRAVCYPLDKLHRILRLGVDTKTLPEELRLEFVIQNRKGEKAYFILGDGKICKGPWQWFRKKADGNP